MSTKIYSPKNSFIYLIQILLLLNQIIKVSSVVCKISVPDSITTQQLNNIICIGTNGFAEVNFASFSNNSLIVETSKDSGTEERVFYGITKEGLPLFQNGQYHLSFNAESGQQRKDSENFVIRINDEKHSEYLMSIGYNTNVEIYDFNQKKVISQKTTKSFIGNVDMDCLIQTGFNYYDGNSYYLYHGYLTSTNYLVINKLNFNSHDLTTVTEAKTTNLGGLRGRVASCYMTKQKFIICIIIKHATLTYSQINAVAYDINLVNKMNIQIDSYTQAPFLGIYPYFIKCVHLKEEIGVFGFYRYSLTPRYPVILFKNYDNNRLQDYISPIILDKKECSMENIFSDLIKVNENKVCFISTPESKLEMYIVIINIYDKTTPIKVAIRYYFINIFSLYEFRFYSSIRLNLYNNFISFAFSFCRSQTCTSSTVHYPGFMIFNYPNGTDFSLNLIDNMFSSNEKLDNFTINLRNMVRIENNIFGLVYESIRIKRYLNCGSINFVSSLSESTNIIENYNLTEDENIIAKNIPLDKIECSIEYTYIITEPSFNEYNSYTSDKSFLNGYNEENFEQEKEKYEGRLLYYKLKINEELSDICPDDICLVCKKSNKTLCVVCKYKYIINKDENGKYKSCVDEGVNISVTYYEEEEMTEPPIIIQEDYDENISYYTNKSISDSFSTDSIDVSISDSIIKIPSTNIDNTNKITTDYYSTIILDKINLTEIINNNTLLNKYIVDKILNNDFKNETLTPEQIIDAYKKIKEEFLTKEYDGNPKVITTENVVYQISTFEYQKDNEAQNISSIDLGDCQNKLKTIYNIRPNDSLIVFKVDYKSEDQKQTFVHYEIYHPYNYSLLDLSLCDTKIIVNTPVDLDDNSIMLYENLKQYGYNIFDSGDDFYNDICSTYTTVNGTDMLIEDRKKNIFSTNGNITMCQTGCEFILYNTTTKKSKCDCDSKTVSELKNGDLTQDHFSSKKLASEFLTTIKNSNFRVLKCYKLALDTKHLFKNIGRIIMTLIFLFYLISLFIYLIKERKKIDAFVNLIIKNKENSKELNLENVEEKLKIKKSVNKEKKPNTKKSEANTKKSGKKKKKRKSNFPPKKKNVSKKAKKHGSIKSLSKSNDINTILPLAKQIDDNKININIYPINNINLKKNTKKNESSKNINYKFTENNTNNIEKLNDQELNSLDYSIAVLIDKRSYLQYYWSLLKKKHLILFTILPANDYNLCSIKVALFLLSISLYFTINGFFFTDSTMHKVNEDNGQFDFIYQIPQILYSSITSAIINMLLKILSLSEKNILAIKQENDIKRAKKESNNIKNCIVIKFVIFFILSNMLLLFFWYFISCFCAVYTNTQIILFKDILISFCFSMIYPFGINLIPGIFRIPALRDKAQKSKYLYQFSGYIALI